MIYEITNIDGDVKEFTTDKDFTAFVQRIFDEQEEPEFIPSRPNNEIEAEHYLSVYCPDLELIIF